MLSLTNGRLDEEVFGFSMSRILALLSRAFWTLLAVLFLALSWAWEVFAPLVAALVALIPLEHLKERIARFLDRLPPYPTLLIFLIPLVVSEVVKAFAIVLFARHLIISGAFVYLLGEIIRFALVAYLFNLCREKLLSIPWVKWTYDQFVRAHHWANAQTAPIKEAIRQALHDAGLNGKPGRYLDKVMAVWRLARRKSLFRTS